jgi:hypothetical protein
VHNITKDAEIYPACGKMSSDRKPIGPRADNGYIDDFSHHTRT